jgi:RHS repeat-associated protein
MPLLTSLAAEKRNKLLASRVVSTFSPYERSKKIACILIFMSILSGTTPAAPQTVAGYATSAWHEARFAVLSSGIAENLPNRILALFAAKRANDPSRAIVRIRIFPGSMSLERGQEAVFAAVAYDSNEEPISGVAFEWASSEAESPQERRLFVDSTFKAQITGTFTITAAAAGHTASETVVVYETNEAGREDAIEFEVSSRTGRIDRQKGKSEALQPELNMPGDGWDDTNWTSADDPGNQTGNPPGMPVDGGAGNGNFQFSAPVVSLPGRGIDLALNLHYNSRVWNKSGNNVSFDVDWDEPAAGWNLGFGRLVSMGPNGGCMIIDADGTRHGYSGTVSSGSSWFNFKGYTTDGGFIDYGCSFSYGNYGNGWSKLANGTTITYSSITPTEGHLHATKIEDVQGNYITITYRNVSGNALIETVTDTMGRVVTFNYDSLNRLISVTGPRMQGQDPIYGSGATRTLIKLHYKQLTLGYSFDGGTTPIVRNGTIWVIDSIYYPSTNTGYWFNDSDSYSSYGMITKVIEQRDMSWSSGSETQGTINAGTMTKRAEYNYPLTTANVSGRTNGTGLTDAPTFDTLADDWDGMDVTGPAITKYKIFQNTSPRVTNVIQPNGTVSRQFSYNAPGLFNDGLVYQDETYSPDASGTYTLTDLGLSGNFKKVAKSNVTWQSGHLAVPRPTLAEVWDENDHKVSTQYTYDTTTSGRFNQILKSCDYDNAGVKLRCAVAEYENSSSYIGSFDSSFRWVSGNHLYNLIKATGIENPDGSKASWTTYEYDNYVNNALVNTPGVIQHSANHNPFNTQTYSCNCVWSCEFNLGGKGKGKEPVGGERKMSPPDCEDGSPPWWLCQQCPVYNSSTKYRGNVTKATTYTDAQTLTGAIDETRSYDITGNVVRISSSCCEERTISYDDPATVGIYDTQYAYPVSQTHGASSTNSPHRITTTAEYSYDTGLVTEATDANGLTSQTFYNPDTLRPVKSVSSTAAYSTFGYDDDAMTVTEEVFELGGTLAGSSVKYLNGIGQVRKTEAAAPGSIVDIVETKYTLFGEEWKQSAPYRSGDTVQWSEKFYDNQRRLIKVVEPDGSETKAFYNETAIPSSATSAPGNKMRVMDAWGRERWGRYDQQGRLVEIVEPNPDAGVNPNGTVSATGNLVTKYSYDTIGRLTQTEQGSQLRRFKFDDLGRLTRQKLAEQTATLDASGTFVGSASGGALWSEAFFYDNRSNLTQKTDARGVRTHFSYQLSGGGLDPLNRIQSRTYDTSGPLQPGLPIYNIWGTTVSYEYMTTGDKSRIQKIVTSGMLTEEYAYDSQSRANEYKQTVLGRETRPMTTNYLYDTLDRVKEVTNPAQWQQSGNPRKIVAHTYDTASRLATLTYDGNQHAGDIVYNASDQTTQIKIGTAGTNQVTEDYTFDPQTGLLTNQKATKGSTTLIDMSYEYNRLGSVGSLSGKTGYLTKIIDNLNTNKNREYEFDALGRLTKAKGGTTGTLWNQTYTFDRYGNRTNVAASGTAADSSPIPLDGVPNLTYDNTSNRIITTGYDYDVAGNQIRALAEDGVTWLKYEYDAANRVQIVRKDDVNQTDVQAFQYGSTHARLIDFNASTGQNTFYASVGGTVMAEYVEYFGVFTWTKSYTYFGETQLATITPNGTTAETVEFNHPDRLGTKLKTNQSAGTSTEQNTLPFGTALNAESTLTNNNKRFTSYDRSAATGLDYAINRTYDNKLGRFTQVDPIGMQAVSFDSPQTLNLYSYCGNDPIDFTDPSGLSFGSFFRWLGHAIMNFFRSGAAKRIAVRFVVSFVASGGNLGVAFRSIMPDILRQIGLNPNPLLTPSWNPNTGHPLSSGVGSLSRYIIVNFGEVVDGGELAVVTIQIDWSVGEWVTDVGQGYLNWFVGVIDEVTFGYGSQGAENIPGWGINRDSAAFQTGQYCGLAASFAIPGGGGVVALSRGVKVGSLLLKASRYKKAGGAGITLSKWSVTKGKYIRKFGIDYHKFKSKRTGEMVTKLHRHSGKTAGQIKKHRGVCSGKEL